MNLKRIGIAVLVVIALAGGGIAAYWYFLQGKIAEGNPALSIPKSAIAVLKTDDVQGFLHSVYESEFWEALARDTVFGQLHDDLLNLDSTMSQHAQASEAWQEQVWHISAHPVSMRELSLLYLCPSSRKLDREGVTKFITAVDGRARFTSHVFQETEIANVELTNGKKFSYANFKGLFAISPHSLLIEDAIRTSMLSGRELPPFQGLLGEQNKNTALVLNFKQLPSLLSAFISSETFDAAAYLRNFASAGNYDFDIRENRVTLYGSVIAEDTAEWAAAFRDLSPQTPGVLAMLPVRTAMFQVWTFEDFPTYFNRQKDDKHITGYNREKDINLEKDILPFVGKSYALAIMEPPAEGYDDYALGLVEVGDGKLIDAFRNLNVQAETETYRETPIRINRSPALKLLLGKQWRVFDSCWYAEMDHHLLFSPSKGNLLRVIDDILAGQTLDRNADYARFSENILSKYNYYLFFNSSRSLMLPVKYLSEDFRSRYFSLYPQLSSFRYFAFQLSAENGGVYNHVSLEHGQTSRSRTELVWKMSLDTSLKGIPIIVENHDTKKKEVLAFDVTGTMYLVEGSGKLIWANPLGSPPVGTVEQIDLYQNDKLQYLFATRQEIQLIDRLGRNVANYPIRLSAPTTTGASIFDFYNNRKHRYFIGCQNNRVYGYEADGKPLRGWPVAIDAPLSYPLQSFQMDSEYYLFGISQKGTIYVLDLNGALAIPPIALNTQMEGPMSFKPGKDLKASYLTSSDTSGRLVRVMLEGIVEHDSLGNWRHPYFFTAQDADGDGENEWIYSANNRIIAYKFDGSPLFSVLVNDSLTMSPGVFDVDGKKLGIYSPQKQQISLMALDGVPLEGFPLQANSMFSLGDLVGDAEKELVVGQPGNFLSVYKIR